MAFFPQFPPQAFYPCPMPYPNQDAMYAVYPPGAGGAPLPAPHDGPGAPVYYDQQTYDPHHHPHHPIPHHHMSGPPTTRHYGKVGYANRKDSADSGISDFSSASSRKASSVSTVSNVSSILEESSLDDVKEEPSAPYEEPDDDLCEKIAQQVEFYFSDANITKDKFLLKHVKRNKEGFVSLKLISSFKRVKHLTKDWRQVAAAIERKSDKLEVNDVKTKVCHGLMLLIRVDVTMSYNNRCVVWLLCPSMTRRPRLAPLWP